MQKKFEMRFNEKNFELYRLCVVFGVYKKISNRDIVLWYNGGSRKISYNTVWSRLKCKR